MTVESTVAYSGPYATNGVATAFPFSFRALTAGEVEVRIDGITVDPSLYMVALGAQSGTVTFFVAPADGGSLYIISSPSFRQGIVFSNQAAFLPDSHNEANDRATVRDIALRAGLDRAIQVPFGETAAILPAASDRIGKFLYGDENGNIVAVETVVSGGFQEDVYDDGLWSAPAPITDDGAWG